MRNCTSKVSLRSSYSILERLTYSGSSDKRIIYINYHNSTFWIDFIEGDDSESESDCYSIWGILLGRSEISWVCTGEKFERLLTSFLMLMRNKSKMSSSKNSTKCCVILSSFLYLAKLLYAVWASMAFSNSVCSGLRMEKYDCFVWFKSILGLGRKSNNLI